MKKILLSSIIALLSFNAYSKDVDLRFFFQFVNKSPASVYIKGFQPTVHTMKADGSATFHTSIDQRRHPDVNFPFLYEIKDTRDERVYPVTIGKEWERMRCQDYEIRIEFDPPQAPRIIGARCIR